MPYISEKDRKKLLNSSPTTAGDLNYLFTELLLEYIETKGESYQTYNDILGALEGCKLEFYRRLVVDYENKKCKDNGDVY